MVWKTRLAMQQLFLENTYLKACCVLESAIIRVEMRRKREWERPGLADAGLPVVSGS